MGIIYMLYIIKTERGIAMAVEEIINTSNRIFTPYMDGLVNHLPMVQWAIYKMSEEEDRLEKFTEEYLKNANIDKVDKEYEKVNSLEEALGKRKLYEGTLDLLKEKALKKDAIELTKEIINKYKFGMSSGLFHTLIRVAYGVEQYSEKSELKEELLRGLAYYVTAYREASLFKREIHPEDIREEMEKLAKDIHIKEILDKNDSLGQRIKSLYSSKSYMEKGFLIRGDGEDKIKSLLNLLIPLYYKRGNIVILHCITGIHAMIILKEYYYDFEEAVDILTSSIITHLISTSIDQYPEMMEAQTGFSWRCIKHKALKSKDVHDIKLAYSACILDERYNIDQLKDISLKRIRHG